MHPDVAWIVGQARDDMTQLGKGDGLLEVFDFLSKLAADHAHRPEFARGITAGAEEVVLAIASDNGYGEEYRSRTADLPADLGFDPQHLLAALDNIRDQTRPGGWKLAVEYIRDEEDRNEPEDRPDPDNYDDAGDLADDRQIYQDRYDYAAGLAYAATATVEHFGPQSDPDPSWAPHEWEDPE